MSSLTRRQAIQLSSAAIGSMLVGPTLSGAQTPPHGHDDSRIRRSHIDLASGARIHYAEVGEASKPVLICLHGYTDSWHSFRPVMPLLAQTHRVLAFDMRGHGDSSASDGDYSLDAIAGDFIGVMKALGIERATLIGHSFGSFVARRIAALNPACAQRIVLVGAGLTADNEPVRGVHHDVVAQGESISREFATAFQASTALDRTLIPEWFFNECVSASLRVKPLVWREALGRLIGDERTARDVNHGCPTLVLGGERDEVFTADDQRALAAAITGARLLLYRHCGHAPNWEQPLRFAEDVQAFAAE